MLTSGWPHISINCNGPSQRYLPTSWISKLQWFQNPRCCSRVPCAVWTNAARSMLKKPSMTDFSFSRCWKQTTPVSGGLLKVIPCSSGNLLQDKCSLFRRKTSVQAWCPFFSLRNESVRWPGSPRTSLEWIPKLHELLSEHPYLNPLTPSGAAVLLQLLLFQQLSELWQPPNESSN